MQELTAALTEARETLTALEAKVVELLPLRTQLEAERTSMAEAEARLAVLRPLPEQLASEQRARSATDLELKQVQAELARLRRELEQARTERHALTDELASVKTELLSEQEQTLALSAQMTERDQRLDLLKRRAAAQETELAALRRVAGRPSRGDTLPPPGTVRTGLRPPISAGIPGSTTQPPPAAGLRSTGAAPRLPPLSPVPESAPTANNELGENAEILDVELEEIGS